MTALDSTPTPSPGSAPPIHPQPEPQLTRAEQVAQGLRELAVWLDEHPHVPVAFGNAGLHVFGPVDGQSVAEVMDDVLALPGAQVQEDGGGDGGYRVVWASFAGGVHYRAQCYRADYDYAKSVAALSGERSEPSPSPDEIGAA